MELLIAVDDRGSTWTRASLSCSDAASRSRRLTSGYCEVANARSSSCSCRVVKVVLVRRTLLVCSLSAGDLTTCPDTDPTKLDMSAQITLHDINTKTFVTWLATATRFVSFGLSICITSLFTSIHSVQIYKEIIIIAAYRMDQHHRRHVKIWASACASVTM